MYNIIIVNVSEIIVICEFVVGYVIVFVLYYKLYHYPKLSNEMNSFCLSSFSHFILLL